MSKKIFLLCFFGALFSLKNEKEQIKFDSNFKNIEKQNQTAQNIEDNSMSWAPFYSENLITDHSTEKTELDLDRSFLLKFNECLQDKKFYLNFIKLLNSKKMFFLNFDLNAHFLLTLNELLEDKNFHSEFNKMLKIFNRYLNSKEDSMAFAPFHAENEIIDNSIEKKLKLDHLFLLRFNEFLKYKNLYSKFNKLFVKKKLLFLNFDLNEHFLLTLNELLEDKNFHSKFYKLVKNKNLIKNDTKDEKFHFKYNKKLQRSYNHNKTDIRVNDYYFSYDSVLYELNPNSHQLYFLFQKLNNEDIIQDFHKISENLIAFYYLTSTFKNIRFLNMAIAYQNYTLVKSLQEQSSEELQKSIDCLIDTDKCYVFLNKVLKSRKKMIWDVSSYFSLSIFFSFLSIITHELGHMLTAKATGLLCSTMVIGGYIPINSMHLKILNNYFFLGVPNDFCFGICYAFGHYNFPFSSFLTYIAGPLVNLSFAYLSRKDDYTFFTHVKQKISPLFEDGPLIFFEDCYLLCKSELYVFLLNLFLIKNATSVILSKYDNFQPFCSILENFLNLQKFEFLSKFDVFTYEKIISYIPNEFKSFLFDFCLLSFDPSATNLCFFIFKLYLFNEESNKIIFVISFFSVIHLFDRLYLINKQCNAEDFNKKNFNEANFNKKNFNKNYSNVCNFSLKETFYNFNIKLACDNLFSVNFGVDSQRAIVFLLISIFKGIKISLFLSIIIFPFFLFFLDQLRVKVIQKIKVTNKQTKSKRN